MSNGTREKDTKERLLDAAEELFACNGYHGTSLRSVTRAAGANVAAVNYHFGSKEALMAAVLERRLVPLNRLRLERLDQVERQAARGNQSIEVTEILRAFIEPTIFFRQHGPGARSFAKLIGRALIDPHDPIRERFVAMISPVVQRLLDLLGRALPGHPRDTLRLKLFLGLGCLAQVMTVEPPWSRSENQGASPLPPQELVDELVRFIAAGILATP